MATEILVKHWHQAITWTNVDLSLVKFSDDYLKAISQVISEPSITNARLKMFLKFQSNLQGVNELTQLTHYVAMSASVMVLAV